MSDADALARRMREATAILEREAKRQRSSIAKLERALDEARRAYAKLEPELDEARRAYRSDARPCFGCGAVITACFGYVKIGDWLDVEDGRRTEFPRELCALCGELYRWNAAGELIPNERPFQT